MSDRDPAPRPRGKSRLRRWLRWGFLLWGVGSTLWLLNSFRTKGVDESLLETGAGVRVVSSTERLEFWPEAPPRRSALVFLCGAGVAAEAYAPLLRPLAGAGHAVFVVRLPYRLAPFESHKDAALERVRRVIAEHPELDDWVVAGHSLGGAMAARLARTEPAWLDALVLIGTTHPKADDLSFLSIPVMKIFGTEDGVAPLEKVNAHRGLLPEHTRWEALDGANHSQFGHYGPQLLDGEARIDRQTQQQRTRELLLEVLERASP